MNESTRRPDRRTLGPPTDQHNPGLSHDDAEALLAIDSYLPSPSPEWIEFLGETLSTWLVEQRVPAGVMDDGKVQWLLARIDGGGVVASPGALAMLRRCCVKAHTVPASLLAYLRAQDSMTRTGPSGASCPGSARRTTGL